MRRARQPRRNRLKEPLCSRNASSRPHSDSSTRATSTTEDRSADRAPVAPSRATATCSTPTCRSASACARTARSTGSSTRRTAHATTSRDLREEMRLVADLGYDFASLYVGGGTPTILLDELCETIDLARELFPSIAEVSAETSPNHLGPELVETLTGRVQRLSCGVQSFDDRLLAPDGPLRQVRHRRGGLRARRVDGGHLPLVQRGHDLQLPEPDRGGAAARHRAGEGHRRQPDDLLPADGLPASPPGTRRDGRRHRLRARGALLPARLPTRWRPSSSPRARGPSRATRTR